MIEGYQVSGRSRMIGTSGRFAPVCFASCLRHGGNEFNGNKRSHLLIENAPHSNLIWEAIKEANPPINADSLEKLIQYQDSSSARKEIIDSLDVFKLKKGLNYIDMLYYASIDTNYSVEEIKDSLANEKEATLRMLLGDLYLGDGEYSESKVVFDSVKVYFKEEKKLLELRAIQLNLFEDTLSYFDLDSTSVADLEEIAFNDTSVAAIEAKSILEFINDTIYPYPYEDKEESSPKRGLSENEEQVQSQEPPISQSNIYQLIPTLIAGEMFGFVTLGTDEKGELVIYSIYGKEEKRFTLGEGTNQIALSFLNAPGIYLYKVTAEGEVKKKDKIVKVR